MKEKIKFLHLQTIKIHFFFFFGKTQKPKEKAALDSQKFFLNPSLSQQISFFSRRKVLFQRFSAAPGAEIPWKKIPEDSAQETPLDTPGKEKLKQFKK